MPVPVLNSRFSPPRLLHHLLPRPQFLQHLKTSYGVISVLVGPPGSGRTSVMSSCYQQLSAAQESVCWVSLSYADNDPLILAEHLQQAFAPGGTTLEVPADLTGFIDGVQWLTHSEALELLENFVLSLPPSSRLMLSTDRLRGHLLQSAQLSGFVTVFGPKQLHFSVPEAAQVLGDQYSLQQVSQLNEWAGGWPAGLRFLARDKKAAQALLVDSAGLCALPDGLDDYLESQLVQQLSASQLEALMELSVLGRFVPELLVAIPQAVSSWALVETFIRDGWMLRYQDAKQHWVSVNPLLASYFSLRMRRFEPARYQRLKYFAAHWLNDHGYRTEAVRHAINLDQPIVAAQLIEQAGAVSLDLGAGPKVVLTELLSAEQAAQFPLLFIGQLYMRIRSGKLTEAYTLFKQAWALTEGFTAISPSADSEEVHNWAQLYQRVFLFMFDKPLSPRDLHEMQQHIERWMIKEPILAAGWASLLAYGLLETRAYQRVIGVCEGSLRLSQLDSQARIAVFLWIHKACAALALGQLDAAWADACQGSLIIQDDPDERGYERVSVDLLKGILLYYQGQNRQAYPLLLNTLNKIDHAAGWAPLYARAFAVAIDCACLAQDHKGAFALLTQGERFAQNRALARLAAHLAVMRLNTYIRLQNWREALQLVDSERLGSLLYGAPTSDYEWSTHAPAVVACAHLMLQLGRPTQALEYLAQLDGQMLARSSCALQIGYWLISAQANFAVRRYSNALDQACWVYQRYRQSQIQQVIGISYAGLAEIVAWAEARNKTLPEGMGQWCAGYAQGVSGIKPSKGLQLLSPREGEVMLLVSEGLTNKEIAQRLQISEGTVKGHRKRIHEKLEVNSRSQAIIKARELLLI